MPDPAGPTRTTLVTLDTILDAALTQLRNEDRHWIGPEPGAVRWEWTAEGVRVTVGHAPTPTQRKG